MNGNNLMVGGEAGFRGGAPPSNAETQVGIGRGHCNYEYKDGQMVYSKSRWHSSLTG